MRGDPEPAKELFSHREDVALGNPFGPFVRGWPQAAETMERAASHYRDGEAAGFETVALYSTADLACLAEVERYRARIGGASEFASIALRVTSVLRREDGEWKIVCRHADPITTAQSAESVIHRS